MLGVLLMLDRSPPLPLLQGSRTMDERRAALQAFKDGDVRFLICTDVAARGLDIQVRRQALG